MGNSSRRARELMAAGQQRRAQLQPQQQHPSRQQVYINAVISLEHAVKRLEEKLKARKEDAASSAALAANNNSAAAKAGGGNHNNNNVPQTMEEIERNVVTQLAEIMLHPPTTHRAKKSSLMNDDDDMGGAISTSHHYPTIKAVQEYITQLGNSIPQRRVCQYPFKRNDIVWVCRTCQSDETCVLCHECFSNSNHDGHDVAFYHAQTGGCCDCGDADAWNPNGFCNKHGGPPRGGAIAGGGDIGGGSGETKKTPSISISSEPAVLGSVYAIAEYITKVVQTGVEEGYKRANPFVNKNDINTASALSLGSKKAPSSIGCRSDSLLPDNYENQDGGRDRRERRNIRRVHSLERRNTVADIESTTGIITGTTQTSLEGESPTHDDESTPVPDDDNEEMGNSRSHPPTPIFHEVQFDPAAASTSRKWSAKRTESSMSLDENDNNIFDSKAASSPTRHRAAKKARAPSSYPPPEVKTPARALGDLGREQGGLFLVLHSDDIHCGSDGPGSRNKSSEIINGLKELFSTPGGVCGDGAASTSGGMSSLAFLRGEPSAIGGGGDTFPNTNNNNISRPPTIRDLQQRRRLMPSSMRSLFRAPYAEAILNKIVQIVKKQGDLIVWGTQEILAECGDVAARCWRDGDPISTAQVGAAMLNRAKILTNHNLVCSIKTRSELRCEQKAAAILKLVGWVASSCDPLCDQISVAISGKDDDVAMGFGKGAHNALTLLLKNDLRLPNQFVQAWHALLLTLLAVPNFKAAMANAYCDAYPSITSTYARGVGLVERSVYSLSVQFLNRVSYVTELVRERNLLKVVSQCLLETVRSGSFVPGTPGAPSPSGASPEMMNDLGSDTTPSTSMTAAILGLLGFFSIDDGNEENLARLDREIEDIFFGMVEEAGHGHRGDSRYHGRVSLLQESEGGKNIHQNLIERTAALIPPTLDPMHIVLSHRRYSVCISDLKCVLNVERMARIFASLPMGRKLPLATEGGGIDDLSIRSRVTDCALDDWIKVSSMWEYDGLPPLSLSYLFELSNTTFFYQLFPLQ